MGGELVVSVWCSTMVVGCVGGARQKHLQTTTQTLDFGERTLGVRFVLGKAFESIAVPAKKRCGAHSHSCKLCWLLFGKTFERFSVSAKNISGAHSCKFDLLRLPGTLAGKGATTSSSADRRVVDAQCWLCRVFCSARHGNTIGGVRLANTMCFSPKLPNCNECRNI